MSTSTPILRAPSSRFASRAERRLHVRRLDPSTRRARPTHESRRSHCRRGRPIQRREHRRRPANCGRTERPLVVDLRSTTYFDSAGVAMLHNLRQAPRVSRCSIEPDSIVRRVLEITGLDQLVPVLALLRRRRCCDRRGSAGRARTARELTSSDSRARSLRNWCPDRCERSRRSWRRRPGRFLGRFGRRRRSRAPFRLEAVRSGTRSGRVAHHRGARVRRA